MKRRALFVGINEYKDPEIRNLKYACRDALSMHDIFEQLGYQTRSLENPSQVDVFNAISEMTIGNGCEDALKPGDQFLMYFAGHGFTDSGQHLLFCADDMYKQLRYHRAGIPFDQLEEETRRGGYDRVFLLDACQSDFLTGTRGEDTTTRDLVAIGDMVPNVEDAKGSFYVLRSCSKFEHALEVESRKHGLFTLGMLELLRQSQKNNVELAFNDSLREAVRKKMWGVAERVGIRVRQTPESDGRGAVQVLLSGTNASILPSEPALPSSAVAAYVICPICGKKNHPENTFKCGKCDRDNLCLRHQDEKTFRCSDCVAKKEKEESDRKTIEQEARATKDGRKSELEQQASEIRVNTRRAIEESNNGNIGKAYEFAQKADLNNDMVQYIIGYALVNGIGCEKDVQGGIDWMLKAAMQGLAPSQYSLGILYLEGKDLHQDDIEAVKWFKKAADNGYAPAQASLSYCYASARGVSKSESAAIMWCRKAAEKGFVPAQYNMGVMYYNGCKAIAKDEAIKWLRMATEKGNNDATKLLSLIEEDGNDAQSLYEKAEDCYHGQNGVKEDRAKAFELYQKAAEQGHADAQYSLGYMYAYGECVAKDEEKALFWYRKAAVQGHEKAGRMARGIESQRNTSWGTGRLSRPQTQSVSDKEAYEKGENFYYGRNGFAQSYADAVSWYRFAARQGHVWAQYSLGYCYKYGQGVARDYAEAVKWFHKAAEEGNAAAQCSLGSCYQYGQGVAKDEAEAVKWFRKSAEAGNAAAQCSLGSCYYDGQGVARNFTEAVKWYRRAVAQENAYAQSNLGLCYEKGQGVTQDYSEAANLYRKAIANGNERAKESLERVEQKIAASLKTKTIRIPRDLIPKTSSSGDCGEEKSVVVLDDCGNNKIAVIAAIRAITGMGLAEAKKLSESTPVAIIRDVAMSECRRIAQQLEKAGARVHYTEASSPARTLGSTLRDARLAKGYSIEQIAAKAKILKEVVQELENDDFHRINAPIYGRGFVKLYAECVGLDPNPLIDKFMNEYSGR